MPPVLPPPSLFLPWMRQGLGAFIATPSDPTAPRASLQVTLELQRTVEPPATATPAVPLAVAVTLPMFGPEDVTGLDERVVRRVSPTRDVSDAEANFLPFVEFSEPDLPWRYTPAAPEADRLQPWLCLLVLAEGEFTLASSAREGGLASINLPVGQALPDLTDAWAWAHVQVSADPEAQEALGAAEAVAGDPARATAGNIARNVALAALVRRDPGRAIARLLAPRLLLERTRYTAFLVPTYRRACRAALGTLQPTDTGPAWTGTSVPAGGLTLPVYFQWTFSTSADGDFETLVRRLEAASPLPPEVGTRAIDAARPGPALQAVQGATPVTRLALPGALMPIRPSARTKEEPRSEDEAIELAGATRSDASLEERLNRIAASTRAIERRLAEGAGGEGDRPLVGPPLYGRWLGARDRVDAPTGPFPDWFDRLNLDVRERITAGVGTLVVQEHQQALLAGAWAQLPDIRRINETLRLAQLSREASCHLYRRDLQAMGTESLLLWTEAAHAHVRYGARTVAAELAASPIVPGSLDPQWRRLSRRNGPLGRRQRRDPTLPPSPFLEEMNQGKLAAARPPPTPSGLVTALSVLRGEAGSVSTASAVADFPEALDADARRGLEDAGRRSTLLGQIVLAARALGRAGAITPLDGGAVSALLRSGATSSSEKVPSKDPSVPTRSEAATASLRAALIDRARQQKVLSPPPPVPPVDLDALSAALLAALDPAVAITESIRSRLTLGPGVIQNAMDPLEPVMAHPEFLQPMYEPLRDLSQEWILPGLDKVPVNSVSLFTTNRAFVEAYMVGLNHEMGRELLWHEYPTDQRGTCFRRFWKAIDTGAGTPPLDIQPIDRWHRSTALGSHGERDATDSLVLLLRGDLLQRFPSTVVYALQNAEGSTASRESTPLELLPWFVGTMRPDVTFLGFLRTREQMLREGHWYFVIQEHPGETRFSFRSPSVPTLPAASRYVTSADASALVPGNPVSAFRTSAQVASGLLHQPLQVLFDAERFLTMTDDAPHSLPASGAS